MVFPHIDLKNAQYKRLGLVEVASSYSSRPRLQPDRLAEALAETSDNCFGSDSFQSLVEKVVGTAAAAVRNDYAIENLTRFRYLSMEP